ncbi:MAG: RNA polymerase sigma factor [Chlorobi bacterium]|nr:MAG: RNA polymerase sigma factor [Bacteroidota bacterium]KXK35174.1 MAG: ECF subfamily RNA polymerase sigma-70 factor [Chlorobi bacterium OLB6]MBE2265813.1 RNA polymerase sigma factor [Flavobacteriales bacterium]MBL1160493.1 RNA polymerase sigma factor [Chlorobiota bacterium]MBW7853258.1 RNA polymerase sigma factor [Candidatus Kapabacteria bacterium]MCC6331253.1 RNA polymerase sigma factor [Ignavibacteria bacterium]
MATTTMQQQSTHAVPDPSDLHLFANLAKGEGIAQQALAELYRRYSQRIYTYCRKITGNNEVARDILQETFVKLFNKGKQAAVIENFPAYLMTIARNLCLTYKSRISREYVQFEDFHLSVRDVPYEQKELLQLIQTALDLLPDEYREAFVLREYNGLSYNEIAEVVGVSLETVKVRIFRAKQKLRDILAPYLEDLHKKA